MHGLGLVPTVPAPQAHLIFSYAGDGAAKPTTRKSGGGGGGG